MSMLLMDQGPFAGSNTHELLVQCFQLVWSGKVAMLTHAQNTGLLAHVQSTSGIIYVGIILEELKFDSQGPLIPLSCSIQ